MPDQQDQNPSRVGGRTTGAKIRRGAFWLVALLIAVLTGTGSVQVISQALFPASSEPPSDCRSGVGALLHATERARAQVPAGENVGEREALATFRTALLPEWGAEAALGRLCEQEGDEKALRAFRAVRFLRYAEERHVRTESLDLARKRSVAPALVRALDPIPSSPNSAP